MGFVIIVLYVYNLNIIIISKEFNKTTTFNLKKIKWIFKEIFSLVFKFNASQLKF